MSEVMLFPGEALHELVNYQIVLLDGNYVFVGSDGHRTFGYQIDPAALDAVRSTRRVPRTTSPERMNRHERRAQKRGKR